MFNNTVSILRTSLYFAVVHKHQFIRKLVTGWQGLFLWGESGRGVKLTTHLLQVPRLRMRGAIPPSPNTFSWRGA